MAMDDEEWLALLRSVDQAAQPFPADRDPYPSWVPPDFDRDAMQARFGVDGGWNYGAMRDLRAWMARVVAGGLGVLLVAVGGLVVTPGIAAAATTFFSFSAGVFAPNQVKHVWWNNANSDAYAAGLEVSGTDDPGAKCHLEVQRTWYQRNASGEREFHLEIEGDSVLRCQATVWLARLTKFRESSTGTLAAGQSRSWHWNNADAEGTVYAVGVLPSQPASGSCAIEVSTQYRTQPDGEYEFSYRATNVGTVTCSATLRHVALGVDTTVAVPEVPAGGPYNIGVPGVPAGTRVIVAGAAQSVTPAGPCQVSVLTTFYQRQGTTTGVYAGYRNTGSVACESTATFALLS
ncbi:hypothetical protein ACFPIJ_43205 [Dactylosporangium cerinum]|uniref:Ig-like domain-containing protein n=1 Tax=Dactylosporangium cerinum TaxID=1434730 RepID=A0ABV9WBE2_9ACTN